MGQPLLLNDLKRIGPCAFLCVLALMVLCPTLNSESLFSREEGSFSVYFNNEKVGYEEFIWKEDLQGYVLEGKGRLEKPIPITFDKLEIKLDRSFIPISYEFLGTISGVRQEIQSDFNDGEGLNRINVSGQVQEFPVDIRRDAFLLPNPLFSPYMVLTKKFRCAATDPVELSAYIIPQLETPFLLEEKEDDPCVLIMTLSMITIELTTDEEGRLISMTVPSQGLRVERD